MDETATQEQDQDLAPGQEPEPPSIGQHLLADTEQPTLDPDPESALDPVTDNATTDPDPSKSEPTSEPADLNMDHPVVVAALAQAKADGYNAGQTEEQVKVSREAGSQERVSGVVESILTAVGQHPSSLTESQLLSLKQAITAQKDFESFDQAQSLALSVLDTYEVPKEALSTAMGQWNAGEPQAFAATIMAGALTGAVAKAKVEWEAAQDREITRRVEAELATRGKTPENNTIPDAPDGSAAGLGPWPQEYRDATPEQRAEWRNKGIEVRIPASA